MPCPTLNTVMNMHQFPNRRTIRIPQYDYSKDGVYFITIDAFEKELIFGDVVKGKMVLNDLGLIAGDCWRAIPRHFPHSNLLDYIVMPNHLHGLVVLLSDEKADTACRVPTQGSTNTESFASPTRGSIPTIIRSYKSAVTRIIHEQFPEHLKRIWQSRYYERVIRDEKELMAAINYIRSNPAKWEEDRIIDGGRTSDPYRPEKYAKMS